LGIRGWALGAWADGVWGPGVWGEEIYIVLDHAKDPDATALGRQVSALSLARKTLAVIETIVPAP
jgi:hypothetical protein